MSRGPLLGRISGTLAVGALVFAVPLQAWAEPSDDGRAQLIPLLKAGAKAAKAKKWEDCISAYSKAIAIEESAVTFGELGLCEEAAGQFASAHPHLKQAVAGLAPSNKDRARYQEALGRVSDLVAVVIVTTTPTDARLVVDGRPLGRGEGRNVAVMPGKHVFSAGLPGYQPASKPIAVNAREFPHLQLTLKPLPSMALPMTSPLAKGPDAASESTSGGASRINGSSATGSDKGPLLPRPLRWCMPEWSARGVLGPAACAAAATLLVSGGTAIGLTVHAQSMRDSLIARGYGESGCAGGANSSPECQELFARGQQRNVGRDVLIGTGIAAGVLLGAASVAIMVEPLNPRIRANVSLNGGGIALQGTW